jgi:SnoaL-like domain
MSADGNGNGDIASLRAEIAELRAAVTRLEAKDHALAVFHRYLYSLDLDRADEVVSCFAPDGVLNVLNFPPGSGEDLRFTGPDAIRPLYDRHAGGVESTIRGGHHAANVSIAVSDDASSAQVSAYFATLGTHGRAQGGMYQLRVEHRAEGWRIAEMNIISGWGWKVSDPIAVTEPVPAARAWRQGRPASFVG